MKIRIVSDLHIDINETQEFGFLDKPFMSELLLIAGDTAGSWHKEYEFLSKLNNAIAVGGNHLGYDYLSQQQLNNVLMYNNPKDETKEDCIKNLQTLENITYLENQYVDIGDYIVYGGTMYTDFLLYGKKHRSACTWTAERWLNDFRYVHRQCKGIRPVNSKDYMFWHKKFMKNLQHTIDTTDKDIIVLSHFAPSIKSIESKYLNRPNRLSSPGSELNAVYACDKEQFIKDNPRIKLWVHGHVHSQHDYMIEQCRVVCCPYGYYHYEQEIPPCDYEGMLIEL